MKDFFTIGELAKYQNISKQTLIYYDKIGLLDVYKRQDQRLLTLNAIAEHIMALRVQIKGGILPLQGFA